MADKEKEYVCGYTHCLHPGEKVNASSSVMVGNKRYHKDCNDVRKEIQEIKQIYIDQIDNSVNSALLSKVFNQLLFEKNGISLDFLRFSIKFYAKSGTKLKSPFQLTYLPKNPYMKQKYEKYKATGGGVLY